MANNASPQQVVSALQDFVAQNTSPLWVAFSGGLDSTVLLHALTQLRLSNPKLNLTAVYVHHGLQAAADDWQSHCKQICDNWLVTFFAIPVEVKAVARQGIEAVARQKRYEAFAHLIRDQGVLLTAHHQRDQAETVLMALARGSGVQGLSGMTPETDKTFQSTQLHQARPLLNVPYEALLAYATEHQLFWVEDPSNQNIDFKRNFVRHEILPKFNQAWSFSEQNIALSASLLHESASLLEQLALIDVGDKNCSVYGLDLQVLDGLDWARQKNVLQYWFQTHLKLGINQSIFEWLRHTLASYRSSSSPSFALANGYVLRIHGFSLYCLCQAELGRPYHYDFENFSKLSLRYPFKTLISPKWFLSHQVDFAWLREGLSIRSIHPSDLQAMPGLKTWFKNHKIAPWLREIWPVLAYENQLVAILGFKTLSQYQNPPV
ncbi:tRNA lysidine(34) synthetase TilS [Thiosulfativibrio zosterae]|uniref:tRNA lysidine(34) synthetase TilS n=1 Tax=Thiosulfativibrio zosterae TaxID=2675053 RepID=UPI001562F23B|nr:tRNA lysidine(34) synthetase TilS [Thiosulfativibrio zosterae]